MFFKGSPELFLALEDLPYLNKLSMRFTFFSEANFSAVEQFISQSKVLRTIYIHFADGPFTKLHRLFEAIDTAMSVKALELAIEEPSKVGLELFESLAAGIRSVKSLEKLLLSTKYNIDNKTVWDAIHENDHLPECHLDWTIVKGPAV